MTQKNSNVVYPILFVVAVLVAIGLIYAMQPQDNSLGARMERAGDAISDGVKDAGRELDPNRTPGEKVGDAIEDVGDSIKDAGENFKDNVQKNSNN